MNGSMFRQRHRVIVPVVEGLVSVNHPRDRLAVDHFLENVNYRAGSSTHDYAVYAVLVRDVIALQLPGAETAYDNFGLELFNARMLHELLELDSVHGFSAADNRGVSLADVAHSRGVH